MCIMPTPSTRGLFDQYDPGAAGQTPALHPSTFGHFFFLFYITDILSDECNPLSYSEAFGIYAVGWTWNMN